MAEIALLASILQIADIGIRLSIRLYTFGETVANANRNVLSLSKDLSLTSSVLKELGHAFEGDRDRIHSQNAVRTAQEVAQECSSVFAEVDDLLLKKVPNLMLGTVDKKSRAKAVIERLRLPNLTFKIDHLNCNLDRLKSTLSLMLNVIIYARQVSSR